MPTDDELRDIYATTQTIAVVGASDNPEKAGHNIPAYLQRQGFR
ncbi:MAG TPA: CoA-binding protein, partial [Actinomycetota bacterium]|nr:CoA-binding protein [Actinomycetota bacterium]